MRILKFKYLFLITCFMAINATNTEYLKQLDMESSKNVSHASLTERCGQLNESMANASCANGTRPYWLLSLDGGGIRGLMHLYALVKLEEITQKSVIDLFDGVAGTSIGGVIACLLTLPNPEFPTRSLYSARDVLEIMLENKDEMVVTNWESLGGILGTHYKTAPVKNFLEKILRKNSFKNRLLPTVLITHDLHSYSERLISTTDSQDFYTKDVAMATCAAPTYCEPQYVSTIDSSNEYLLSDGGTAMNNPVLAGIALIQQHYGASMDDICAVSFGTGVVGERHNGDFLRSGGCFDWACEIADLCIDGQLSVIESTAKLYLGNRYYRFNPYLGKGNVRLDDVSERYIRTLRNASSQMLDANNKFSVIAAALQIDANNDAELKKEERSVGMQQQNVEKNVLPPSVACSDAPVVAEWSCWNTFKGWLADLCG